MQNNRYRRSLRTLHWLIAACVMILVPIGIWMSSRGAANVWDDLTNTLYAWHKAIGFLVLWVMLIRVVVKLRHPVVPYPQTLSAIQIMAAKSIHIVMYLLLILVPIIGWAGVTAYPALITIGGMNLPAMPFIAQSESLAKQLFNLHGWLALTLGAIALGHIAMACKHLLIDRDDVFQRMWSARK